MKTVLVYTKSIKQDGRTFNSEVDSQEVEADLSTLQGGKDFIVDAEGRLLKVLEKIANLGTNQMRILVREMK